MLDLTGSVGRELFEETGLDIGTFEAEPGWTLVRDGGFLALMKRIVAGENAETLRARIMRHLAKEAQPEFSEIRFLRGPADFDPRHAAISHRLSGARMVLNEILSQFSP